MRSTLLRSDHVTDNDLRKIGLPSQESSDCFPLHQSATALDAARNNIPKNEHGIPVVPGRFDPYLSCVLAPDHLMQGLAKSMIKLCVRVLHIEYRKVLSVFTREALRSLKIFLPYTVIDDTTVELNVSTLSQTFPVLMVAQATLRMLCAFLEHDKSITLSAVSRKAQTEGDYSYFGGKDSVFISKENTSVTQYTPLAIFQECAALATSSRTLHPSPVIYLGPL